MNHERHEKHENKGEGLVPRLRFPEFRDAGEWQERPLSAFIQSLDAGVSANSGDRPATANEKGILKTSAVTDGVFDAMENKVVADDREMRRLKEPVAKNTIIISRMNTPGLVGANAYIKEGCENLFLPDRLWAAKPRPNTSMRFIAYILGSGEGRAALSELATGTSGSMKNIAKANVLELPVVIPGPKEQQKIADCLSSLDALIAAQADKIDALKTHKKGLVQQLFPREGETVPRLRFPEFRDAGEWEVQPLGDVCQTYSGGTPASTHKKYYGGDIPFIRSAEIDRSTTELKLTQEGLQSSSAKMVGKGDILYALYGANSGQVAISKIAGAINQAILCLKSKDSNPFIYQFLSFNKNRIIDRYIQGGQGNLSGEIVKSIEVPFPELKEQKIIADCLSSLDALIAAHTEKLDALMAHKKGLMQQLFPSPEAVGV